MIAAVVMIPLIAGPLFWDLDHNTERTFLALDGLIWAIFAIDFIVKFTVAPNKSGYLKHNWLDLLLVLIPWFRPLRIVRVIILAARSYQGATRIGKPDFLLLYAIALIILATTAMTTLEQGSGSELSLFPNALWWSVVTITTVGYGDMYPVTEAGRAIGYVLMFGGIGIFGAITANLAVLMSKSQGKEDDPMIKLTQEVKLLRNEINRLATNNPGMA